MSWQRYPNANYPEAYPEANMVKATDVPTNEDGGLAEIQSVWNDATGGTFTFSYDGQGPTGALNFDAANVSVAAQGTVTLDTQPTDGDTYTLDGKTYTFQDSLTDVDGNVDIGGSLAQAKLNFVSAIDLSGVAGTDYATSMTAHTTVSVAAFVSDDAVITALTAGTGGNSIVSTETFAAGGNVFDAATLGTTTLGTNGVETELELFSNITNVSVTGAGSLASPWLIEFLDPDEEDIVLMTADDGNLTGDTIGTTIEEYLKGRKSLSVTTATGAPL